MSFYITNGRPNLQLVDAVRKVKQSRFTQRINHESTIKVNERYWKDDRK